ncbi:MAG: adenosylcobinamide-GDP ribazoletransferase [Alphaproteobacteria bacterium]|nr:adenosylcobinamide-GDP ribazoletransferase [Alphaproteobacteria bacterium]
MGDSLAEKNFEAHDILAAFGVLSRLPLTIDHARAGARAARATWAYPVVGAGLGAVAALAAKLALFLGVPAGISAAIALGALVLMSGAMHEDGIADCADGLGGGNSKSHRLEIMKDSRIGAYGATVLGIVLIARWSGIQGLAEADKLFWPLIAIGAASRLPMVLVMFFMPSAREDGLSAGVGMPPPTSVAGAIAATVLLSMLAMGWGGAMVIFWGVIAPIPLLLLAKSLIGGQTGDILGATQQLAEIACISVTVALIT